MLKKLYEYLDNEVYIHHAIDRTLCESDYSMHAHDCCEILGFIRGKARCVVEGRSYKLEPGCIIITRPTEIHRVYVEPGEPYERIMLNFRQKTLQSLDPDGILMQSFLDRPLGTHNLYRPQEFQSATGLFFLREMVATPARTRAEQRLNLDVNLLPLLNTLRTIFLVKQTQGNRWNKRDVSLQVIDYINAHLHDELSLDRLSEEFFLSRSQISRIFKKATGSSVLDYITIKRLIRAREYILNGETAANACHLSGFDDYSTFYRAWRRRFSGAPSDLKPTASVQRSLDP